MSFLGLFTNKTVLTAKTDSNGNPILFGQSLTLDANISEDDSIAATVTDHPVESGAIVADHIRDESDVITINGIVSRTPIENPVSLLLEDPYRHETAWLTLYNWIKGHILVEVATSSKTWENMAITKLERTRAAEVGEALQVTIGLKAVVFVQSSTVGVPPTLAGVQHAPTDAGKGTTNVANSSIANQIAFGGN